MLFSYILSTCPLVPSWATTIHKFQGFKAGFDRNDQFQHLIINPGDITSEPEQQQPGILYVAMSHAKTMGDMTNDTPNPRNRAVYWTGFGMSKNRVLHSSTKKQIHTQGQERVNCLKIEKRDNWVNSYTCKKCKDRNDPNHLIKNNMHPLWYEIEDDGSFQMDSNGK
jgi:hypothetical protein